MEVIPTGDLKLSAVPQEKELEQLVLGVFLIEKNAYALYADKLHEGCFYDFKNKIVYNAIRKLFKDGKGIDLITVAMEAKGEKNGEDMPYYCTSLTTMVASSAHVAEWIQVLLERFISRELIKTSQWVYYSALDPANDVLDIYGKAQSKFSEILNKSVFSTQKSWADILKETIDDIKDASDNRQGVIGHQTKFEFIDKNMMGLVAPDMTIIAARPGMGKSTLAMDIAINLARQGIPVGYFSLEMKDRQLMTKVLSQYIPETVNNIRSGNLSKDAWSKLGNEYDNIANLPIWLNDRGHLNIEEMKAIIKTWIMKYGIKAFFIDYLQLMAPAPNLKGANRETIVSYNARFIKSICMECDLSGIVLSQLSREGGKGEPELHHLRESGAIEQDADNVVFINMNENETEIYYPGWVEGNPEWIVDIMLKKCRLGSLGKRKMIFNAAHNIFKEIGYSGLSYGCRDYTEPKSNETPF